MSNIALNLDDLIRRDFIRYILLKTPDYDEAEVSAKLKKQIDADMIYHRLMKRIPALLDQYLSLDNLRDASGNITNVLPQGLTPEVSGRILSEYKAFIAAELEGIDFISGIVAHTERLVWAQGIDDMAAGLRRFTADLLKMAGHLKPLDAPDMSRYDIAEKHDAAQRITLRERIMRDNHKDITAYISALRDYSKALCEYEVTMTLSRLYTAIARSETIEALILKFERIHPEAQAEYHRFSQLPIDEKTEREYQDKFPVDFFSRNIEDITPAKAFQAVLLLSLSRHEEKLKEQGYMSPTGELTLFTNPRHDGSRWKTLPFNL